MFTSQNNTQLASKDALRRVLIKKRSILSANFVKVKSAEVSRKFKSLKEVKKAKNFLVYLPLNNEVDTKAIIDYLTAQGSNIFVPAFSKVDDRYRIVGIGGFDDLEYGPYKILQPKKLQAINADEIDVALIPGVAFDRHGVRLGYGKGVYDRLLGDFKGLKIGLAYDLQIVDEIPREKHDTMLDFVITESKTYAFT